MGRRTVHTPCVVAIPVGTRVEVRIFLFPAGLFGQRTEARADRPLIRDLTTGVLYGEDDHFQEIAMYRSGDVRPDLPMEPRRDLVEHERFEGEVTACRVAWIGKGDGRFPQTTLIVDVP